MLLQQARAKAISASRDGCVQYVNARLTRSAMATPFTVYIVDFQGYSVSDWKDGTTVESYQNGRLRD